MQTASGSRRRAPSTSCSAARQGGIGTESRPAIVIDSTSFFKLVRKARIWGYQHNQIAHELNRIAYHLRRDMADAADVLEELQGIEKKLDKANEEIASLRVEAEHLTSMHIALK